MGYAQVAEVNVLAAANNSTPSVQVSNISALVSLGPVAAQYADVGNVNVLVASRADDMSVEVAQVNVLVAYLTGTPAVYTTRAWGFNLDQHQFYVLHLGLQGTFVYDIMTASWSQWQTAGYVTWNMEYGSEWNRDIYAGSGISNQLWKVDKYGFLDEGFRTITRVVTGGIGAKGRETIKTGPLILDTTPQGTIGLGVDAPSIRLDISDDNGQTFQFVNTITVDGTAGQDITYRGLGSIQQPGRVFKITDTGAMVRINLATLLEAGKPDGR